MTQENKTLADFLESERKEFDETFWELDIAPVDYSFLTNWLSTHDTRLLAFVREWAERYKKFICGREEPTMVLDDLLSLLTPPTKV